jgi:hypothetical protein
MAPNSTITFPVPSDATRFPFGSYSDEQWANVEKALQHLEPKRTDLEDARTLLEFALKGLLFSVAKTYDRPTFRERRKTAEREWARISKLTREVQRLWRARMADEPPVPPGNLKPPSHKMVSDGLLLLDMIATRKCANEEIDDGFPKAKPQTKFNHAVLDVWTRLGGELKFSRHPKTQKIKGPLARYFEAATKCIYGGSLESLPDIVRRDKQYSAELKKWRAMRAAANGEQRGLSLPASPN